MEQLYEDLVAINGNSAAGQNKSLSLLNRSDGFNSYRRTITLGSGEKRTTNSNFNSTAEQFRHQASLTNKQFRQSKTLRSSNSNNYLVESRFRQSQHCTNLHQTPQSASRRTLQMPTESYVQPNNEDNTFIKNSASADSSTHNDDFIHSIKKGSKINNNKAPILVVKLP